MSSRNAYLNADQHRQALVLSRSLQQVKAAFDAGEARCSEVDRDRHSRRLRRNLAAKLDYFAIVDPETLEPVPDVSRGTLVAVAAWVGTTRLIDNLLL